MIDDIVLYFFENNIWDWNMNITKINKLNYKMINLNMLQDEDISNILAKKENIIVPLLVNDQIFVIKNILKTNTENKATILCCDDEQKIKIFDDKVLFTLFMLENNFSQLVPETYTICNDKITQYHDIEYPCIYKKAIGYGGMMNKILINPLCIDNIDQSIPYLIQKFIFDGEEHALHGYVLGGKIISAVCYKNTIKKKPKLYVQCGKMIKYEKINDYSSFELEFNKIFCALNYTGYVCINFKVCKNEIKIFEINPRLGGTLITNYNNFQDFLINLLKNIGLQ